jgi:hypothetical protein
MDKKLALVLSVLVIFFALPAAAFSQIDCNGKSLFTEKKCLGDEVSSQEKELFKLINDYRAQNKLPQISLSASLSALANRHLLDLAINVGSMTHGWSNCPYDLGNQNTWNCVSESPQRLKIGYAGEGYENLYRNKAGDATPMLALEAWKKSALHKSLILNLNFWSAKKWDAFGVAIRGEYVALWFGAPAGAAKTFDLNAFYDAAARSFGQLATIKKSASAAGDQITGFSDDKSVVLSVTGNKTNAAAADVSIKVKLDKNSELGQKNKNILKSFVSGAAANWKEAQSWIDSSLKKIRKNPKSRPAVDQAGKNFVMNRDAENYICVTVKPGKK